MTDRPPYRLEYRTVRALAGPLLVLDRVRDVGLGEVGTVIGPDGEPRTAQVLEIEGERAVVQVFEGTGGSTGSGRASGSAGRRPAWAWAARCWGGCSTPRVGRSTGARRP